MSLRRTILWTMIASMGLAALLGIAALLLPHYGLQEEILYSVSLFGIFSMVALLCAIVLEKGRVRWLMWGGITCSAVAMTGWLVLVWAWRWSLDEVLFARMAGSCTIAAAAAAHAGLLVLPRFDARAFEIVRSATIGIGAGLAAFGILLVWWEDELARLLGWWIIERGGGAVAILGTCGTVVTPILWKVQSLRRADEPGAISGRAVIELVCPRCALRQHLAAGRRSCAGCGLKISIEVQEPRCACGFLLHALRSDQCPECGRSIPEPDRWRAGGAPCA